MSESVRIATAEELYNEAAATYGAAMERLARAYEADADRRQDLLQEIHLALWRSFHHYAQRCSLRTWIYQVAHNTAASHVLRQQRTNAALVSLDDVDRLPMQTERDPAVDRHATVQRLLHLVRGLKPIDRQVMLLYLEGLDAGSIAEITGITPANVAMKVHRVKEVLILRFGKGGKHVR